MGQLNLSRCLFLPPQMQVNFKPTDVRSCALRWRITLSFAFLAGSVFFFPGVFVFKTKIRKGKSASRKSEPGALIRSSE